MSRMRVLSDRRVGVGRVVHALQGGRPPRADAARYAKRHVIENSFERFKQWRGLATRYDKLASTYRAAALLRAILLWLPDLAPAT